MSRIDECKQDLLEYVEEKKATMFPKFFKAFPGGYGEGDKFLGIRVPNIRKVAKKYKDFTFKELSFLIQDEYHEVRMCALFILIICFEKAKEESQRKKICDFYLKNINAVNNWDLVDSTAHKILGAHLEDKNRELLYEYAATDQLWLQRIAIIATFCYIRHDDYDDALKISEILLHHKHDLIHKAVGWMLREVGNRNLSREEEFLKKYYMTMPRTMLRYAIEKFDEPLRKKYLHGEI